MTCTARTFWLARKGHTPAEYEDAFAADEMAGRYAVTDGATESCFAALWARLLVEDFVHGADPKADRWSESLSPLQKRWNAFIGERKLAWYDEPGVKLGAFATFLGLVLTASSDSACRWEAVAVGDTCLLHTRSSTLLRAFPLEHSRQFGDTPKLVGSRMSSEDIRHKQAMWSDGCGQAGDRLWIMTDALAQWCLAAHEVNENPWGKLESLLEMPDDGKGFALWIEEGRDAGRLRNDDVTLLAIRL